MTQTAPARPDPQFCYLICQDCTDERHVTSWLPFLSEAKRAYWATKHTEETGHDRWWVSERRLLD